MAGPSSEAGYVNIGTAENSSHPETEPEIEDVEAGDSDEVCGLERKECDHIMEHLKNNPGLVVQSLGPEGRIVLHVAVMAGETKKPKPPALICTEKGLSEAAVGSEWYRALKRKDCNALMALLEANPCLLAQTDPEGRTVVHAAAQRGCLKLLDQVFDLFKDNDHFVDKMSGVKVALDDLGRAKCGTFEAEAHHMAWFKCPVRVWRFLRNGGRKKSTERFSSDAQHSAQYLTDELVEIMQQKPPKEAFKSLERTYQQDLNYNFVLVREELQFHYACSRMIKRPAERVKTPAAEYVKTVIDGCRELEPTKSESELLTHLFQLHNAQGQTPLHLVLKGDTATLLKLLPLGDEYKECLNARDARGWTALHCAAATGNKEAIKALLEDEWVDVNARTCTHRDRYYENKPEEAGMTALHLAILHDDVSSVELLLECKYTNVNALLHRQIGCGCEKIMRGDAGKGFHLNESYWSPLQLAAIMGLSDVVRALLGSKGKLQKINITMENDFQRISALLLASASGNPDVLQLFLESQMFDPLVKFKGATALHYATNAMIPRAKKKFKHQKLSRFLYFSDLGHLDLNTCKYEEEPKDMKLSPTLYIGRQACITMLLQAGVDIWEKDDQKRFAEPGPQTPEDAHLWWHEKMAHETLEAKKSLNDASNAISVVAALVATASFVGPLQPPLGYGGDSVEGGVQDIHSSIRVFMVSNILSFYLAVASIMFAVVPSLPMPQEGIYAEWQRTKRTVGVAIFFLLMSVLGVLISFGAASNSVVLEDYSWQHLGLSFYPTLLGGFICILGISLFFLRLLRLVFNRNARIIYLYKTFVKF